MDTIIQGLPGEGVEDCLYKFEGKKHLVKDIIILQVAPARGLTSLGSRGPWRPTTG